MMGRLSYPSGLTVKTKYRKNLKDRTAKKTICEQLLECPSSANLSPPSWPCLLCWKYTPGRWVVGQQPEPHSPAQGLRGVIQGLPGGSGSKESACNAGDPGSIPKLGRSDGEGIGYPFQYSWASLVAQLVKNLPVLRETWVQSLGWKDPLEKGKAILNSSILVWRIPWTVQSMGSQRVGHD